MQESKQTLIEILLEVDSEGKTTARKLYEFLNLSKGQFARWAKTNILENTFAENGVDFKEFYINVEGNLTKGYKLTTSFAKKLAMREQVREYFIKVEEKLKQEVNKKSVLNDETKSKLKIQKMRAEVMALNAKSRTFNTLMKSIDNKHLSPIAI